jgi:hypothetical protein
MENLQDHVLKPTDRSVADHLCKFEPINDIEDKVEALEELPKRKAFAFLQTVHQNMEGFTKHEVKWANLAHIAQVILGHLISKELSQVVSSNLVSTTVLSIP